MKFQKTALWIMLSVLLLAACGPLEGTATNENHDPLPDLPTATSTPTLAPMSPQEPKRADFDNSILIVSLHVPLDAGGPITSCNLVSSTWNTPDIMIGANIFMPDGVTPAGNIPVAMVLSDKNGNLRYDNDGNFIVLSAGQLTALKTGETGAFTHSAVFPGVSLLNGGNYAPLNYQLRALNPDNTLDGQIGGPDANCSISKNIEPSSKGGGDGEPALPASGGGEGGGSGGGGSGG